MNPILSLLIDNISVPPVRFALPEMSLSSARVEMFRHSFVFTIDTKRMVEFLDPVYADWVDESKRDDEICGVPQDDLALAGYPELIRLVGFPELLEQVLGYLLKDFLGKLTWDDVSPIEYWFDCVTGCEANDRHVRLSGVCYSKE